MDVEKLIERLKECGTYGFKQEECREAAEALENLQIELKAMRGAANSYKAENERLQAELEKVKAERDAAIEETERMKAIMRENGIMTIPSKYCIGRLEWNV